MFKKFFTIIVVMLLVLPITLPEVSANVGKDYTKIQNENLKNQEKELVSALKKVGNKYLTDQKDIETKLQKVLEKSDYDVEKITKKLRKSSPFPEMSIEELEDTEELDLNSYIKENVAHGNFRVEEISKGVSIIFTNEDLFFINYINIDGELELEEDSSDASLLSSLSSNIKDITEPQTVSAATYYSGRVTEKYVAYSWVGMPIWEIWTEGEFSYNKSTYVQGHFYDGDVDKRWGGVVWQIDNYAEGTTQAADKSWATVYTRANFHYGLEYSGVGLVVQYLKVKAQIRCDKYGKISKSTIID
ncbi:hypothetical protein ACOI1C_12790 [Bacillus sp. DJP31]|uniref:hypothetical protein n=1 Tax=Bacillus sp. DJP31 TaxID=3409789 RepID=UPI003BB529BC